MIVLPAGAELFNTEKQIKGVGVGGGQRDMMKLTVVICNFKKAPKNVSGFN
jgi:hypothetical protein